MTEEGQCSYKMTIAYDGTHYNGWQIQAKTPTVQGVLQETLKKFLQQQLTIIGSGRTDAGVHALGQVAHFRIPQAIDEAQFLIAANSLLPEEIRILDFEKVPNSFHAQYSAVGKIYHYHISMDSVKNPFTRLYSLQLNYPIHKELLLEAAQKFLGTHDFRSFANVSEGGVASYDSVRTLTRIDLVPEPGGMRIEFEGDGFLYKMVRNLVGMLLEVAAKKREVHEISEVLAARDRRKAAKAAPAHGLFLAKVHYKK